jgi:PAS domain S-box-containing protein
MELDTDINTRMNFSQLIESCADMVFRINDVGNFIYVNPAVPLNTGYSTEALLKMNFTDLVAPEKRKSTLKFIHTVVTDQLPLTYHEICLQAKDGTEFWIGQNIHFEKEEEQVTLLCVARNITEKVKTDELRENWILRLSVLIENLQEGVLMEDENRKILLVNRAFCDLFSVRLIPEDLIGKQYLNAQNHIKRLFKDSQEFIKMEEDVIRNKHIFIGQALKLANGKVYERDYVPIYIETGYAGNLWKYRDSTEKVRTRNELLKAKNKYKNVIETMRLGLLEVDHDDRIMHANEAFCEILGYDSPQELVGKKSFDTLLDPEQQQIMKTQMANRDKGQSNTYEIKVKRADGNYTWMLISGAALFDENDNVIGSVGVHLDISYQKQISMELEEKKSLKNMMEWQEKSLVHLEEKVVERTSEVMRQKEIIEEKNIQITKSIEYAFRIQQALLTPLTEIQKTFPGTFILYRPMDIVGGDFYLFRHAGESSYYMCAVDSTGHGVPGGFMSMLGFENLKDAISKGRFPGDIISIMNTNIKNTLNPNNYEISLADGFDLGMVMIDTKTNEVHYSGAFRPLWITRPDSTEIEEVKGTRASIGGRTSDDQVFETHRIKLNKGDTMYLFTDGCTDQFNEAGKRMTTRRFKEVLLTIKGLEMKEQSRYIERFLETWQGNADQTDDIMLIGIRL